MIKYDEGYIQLVKNIGENIRNIRIKKNLSIKELANKTGFSKSYLYELEKGKTLGITIKKIIIISKILEVKPSEIF